ncbi:hypothetical protein PIB30_062413 [Stylosanthes scabra]|uniref:Uncharacterized protein n=1 Tax=Stylosanthes scabra TaxID=79078 RepID=A0ABU6UM07_9FABA|nr:hypothetical protein [Stylosanthes scabra]
MCQMQLDLYHPNFLIWFSCFASRCIIINACEKTCCKNSIRYPKSSTKYYCSATDSKGRMAREADEKSGQKLLQSWGTFRVIIETRDGDRKGTRRKLDPKFINEMIWNLISSSQSPVICLGLLL